MNQPAFKPIVQDKLRGMGGFLQTLAGYYCQFLETDFKKGREPKRKFALKDKNNQLTGIRVGQFRSFREDLCKKLNAKNPSAITIKPRKYTSSLSKAMKSGIQKAINATSPENFEVEIRALFQSSDKHFAKNDFDLELIVEEVSIKIRALAERHLVDPVLAVITPIFEKANTQASGLDHLLTYTDELTSVLCEVSDSMLPTAMSDLAFLKSCQTLDTLADLLCNENNIKERMEQYFSTFSSSDLFTELRDILNTVRVTDNTQIYVNLGEIRKESSAFPLYYIPIQVRLEGGEIYLELEQHIYVYKKAVEYIIGLISEEQKRTIPNPISERIFYKNDDETYIDVALRTFHHILQALQVQGEVDIGTSGNSEQNGAGLVVSNNITLSLFDKSDESIVNDYEALMTGLEGGGLLFEAFKDLVEKSLSGNPDDITAHIDNEWDETSTADRLVFASPLPLAEEQRKVLAAIRNPDAKFISVEGPPGTGKSHTIAAIAFEMILKGKNILILSDKKEALDVAEGKLNDVLSRVRGTATEYVNPILRLGKSDSNYLKITKRNSVDKLKVSLKTFKGQESAFNNMYLALEQKIKDGINETINSSSEISFKLLSEFQKLEDDFFDEYQFFEDLDDDYLKGMALLHEVVRLIDDNRESIVPIFNNDRFAGHLDQYLKAHTSIISIDEEDVSLGRKYVRLDIERASCCRESAKRLREMPWYIFGYLFCSSKLREEAQGLESILGTFLDRPQDHISELQRLADYPGKLKASLSLRGVEQVSVPDMHTYVTSRFRPSEKDLNILEQYQVLDHEAFTELSMPVKFKDLVSINSDKREMYKKAAHLCGIKEGLQLLFDKIPDHDYFKDKTQLESLNAKKLANTIDKRVVDFVTDYKADAKTLGKIIKDKSKFPTDKFDVLKQAFPCMIAGLRDFAEFIPLSENLFDLIIIDEASQVSIAQALPAILRARKMIVMGDRRQFGNVKTANASKALNNSYFNEVKESFTVAIGQDISKQTRCEYFNIGKSVMDFFEMVSNYSIQLKKHFRGYPEMIGFSSKFYYEETLQALKIRGKAIESVLEFVELDDQDRIEPVNKANRMEADWIIDYLLQLCELEEAPSVAVITPHSQQQKLVQGLITDHPNWEEIYRKLRIAVFTFDSCQGEERDLIIYSMVATREYDTLNYVFPKDIRNASEDEIDGKLKFQRLNVGFSRGKEKLLFLLSKPLDEFRGSIFQTLDHYRNVLVNSHNLPNKEDLDEKSEMEPVLLEWIQQTGFYTANSAQIEIIPQFELGLYLKALTPDYTHANYKVDFLVRYTDEDKNVFQIIIEYDGFENHFTNHEDVDGANWRSYLTADDIERERILESFGYKMLRVNRFNIGPDPIAMLDERLSNLFHQLDSKDETNASLSAIQQKTTENIKGLEEGTHKRCSKCDTIKPMEDFYDASLETGYGRICMSCKSGNSSSNGGYSKPRRRKKRRRRYY